MPTGSARVDGVTLVYETFGSEADPALVLVMGLGVQLLGWHEDFCAELAGRGHYVVRFDNRDAGLSTHLDDSPRPDVLAALSGDTSSAAYSLEDMADDTVGLLDALGIEAAHLVGASMGGMIAQTVAVRHRSRVRSLTSIMSTTGAPDAWHAQPEARALLAAAPAKNRHAYADLAVANLRTIGSPAFPFDEAEVRERALRSYDRCYDPMGVGRQLVAIHASGDRTPALRRLDLPTLVVHGAADPLIGVGGGRATAAAVPGAELLVIEGMGHDLPRAVWPRVIDAISAVVRRGRR